MIKLLTSREMELFRLAIHIQKKLDDANPEVGMVFDEYGSACRKILSQLSFEVDADDIMECLESIKGS